MVVMRTMTTIPVAEVRGLREEGGRDWEAEPEPGWGLLFGGIFCCCWSCGYDGGRLKECGLLKERVVMWWWWR